MPLLDYGARFYNPTLARWTTIDPLAEKYYSISPYAFCNNNPVNFVDPDGEDVWEINSKGIITWVEESDEHRLYYIDTEGNRGDNYIAVNNRKILDAFTGKDGIASYTDDSNIDDFFKVFLFAADNSDVEWALHRGQDNSYTIGTLHDEESSGNWADYGIQKPIASVHSHPEVSTEYTAEVESMGYWYNGALPTGDWGNVIRDVNLHGYQTRMNYVYFPNSTRLYHIEYKSVSYIRKISNYKNFYFGTLNHK